MTGSVTLDVRSDDRTYVYVKGGVTRFETEAAALAFVAGLQADSPGLRVRIVA